jgi:hypothetical protein
MVFSDISEKIVNVATNVYVGSLDTGNDLISLTNASGRASAGTNLRDNVQPCIDFNFGKSSGHRIANIIMCTKFEP